MANINIIKVNHVIQGLTTYSQSTSLLGKLIGFEKVFLKNNENLLFGMLLFQIIIDNKYKYLKPCRVHPLRTRKNKK